MLKPKFLTFDWPSNWFWPVAIVSILLLTHGGKKCYIIGSSCYYMISRQDKRCLLPNYDPGYLDDNKILKKRQKRFILIRHAESTWNEVFNRRIDWSWPIRLMYIIARECLLFVTSDSVLIDAPLSESGISQACDLQENLYSIDSKDIPSKDLLLLKEGSKNTILVCSPLRRCIETLTLGLFPRLNNNNNNYEKIILVSHLQEVTSNLDGMSLCGKSEIPPTSIILRMNGSNKVKNWDDWLLNRLDTTYKEGFKPSDVRADDRMRAFISWAFSNACDYDNIIMCGHSLWFRNFFNAYLPRTSTHVAKKNKIHNTGVIALDFTKYEMNDGSIRYRIEPESISILHKGFEVSKKYINQLTGK